MKRMSAVTKRATTDTTYNDSAKVANIKDIAKVLDYFQYTIGTTLDCALETGVLRNSITWHVAALERDGLLGVAWVGRDKTTGYKAKHYTANPDMMMHRKLQQLTLFKEDCHG